MRKPTDKSSEFSTCIPVTSVCTWSYGVVENGHATTSCHAFKENTSWPIVHLIVNYILKHIYYLATEKLLPLSFVSELIEFSQFVSRDCRAFSQLDISSKMVSQFFVRKKVVELMKKYPFNITSTNAHSATAWVV